MTENEEILSVLANKQLDDFEMCRGDDDHPAHVTLYFGDKMLEIVHAANGFMMVLYDHASAPEGALH